MVQRVRHSFETRPKQSSVQAVKRKTQVDGLGYRELVMPVLGYAAHQTQVYIEWIETTRAENQEHILKVKDTHM